MHLTSVDVLNVNDLGIRTVCSTENNSGKGDRDRPCMAPNSCVGDVISPSSLFQFMSLAPLISLKENVGFPLTPIFPHG